MGAEPVVSIRTVRTKFRGSGEQSVGHRLLFVKKMTEKFVRFFGNDYSCSMNRFGVIFLSILLLLSTSGVSVNQHWCGGELLSVSVNDFTILYPSDMDMPECEQEEGCGQCHNKHFHEQIQDSFSSAHSPQLVVKSFPADWFHAHLFSLFQFSFSISADGKDGSAFGLSLMADYHPPYLLPPHGVRGAPALLG